MEAGELDWRNLTPDEWLWLDDLAIAQLESVGYFESYEKEYLRKDGTRIPILLGGARVIGTDEQVCYIIDLTERKNTELALAASEARYRALAEALPHIVVLTDAEGNALYMNAQWRDYTGLEESLALDARRQVVHPDDLAMLDERRSSGHSYEAEARLRRADGEYRWHLIRARYLERSDDLPRSRVSVAIDIDDRKRFEASLHFLATVGDVLSRARGLQETLETLLQLIVPDLGDWATVNVREPDGRIHTLAARHADPEKAYLARRLQGAYYYNEDATVGTPAVFRGKKPSVIAHVMEGALAEKIKPEYRSTFAAMGLDSFISLPIRNGDDVIGTFGIGAGAARRPLSEEDLPRLDGIALRAAVAIENALAFDRERHAALTFQEAALPAALPDIPGVTLDCFYQAGTADTIVGGDWYDALRLPDGRLVVSIGDVCGRGLPAAVLMSSVRQVIRGIAQMYVDPLTMLDAADRVVRGEREFRFVTAFVGVIDPSQGMTMTYASAGHVPPLIRHPDGNVEELSAPGVPLGYRDLSPGEARRTVLHPGSVLVLFTDGLVEFSHDICAGEAALTAAVERLDWRHANSPARDLCDAVLGGAVLRDDVAVLSVRVDG